MACLRPTCQAFRELIVVGYINKMLLLKRMLPKWS